MLMGMIDIGGYALYAERAGTGSPAVVLEAGGAGTSADWASVLPAVAEFTHVLSYDRAGSGRSHRSPLPISLVRLADEMRAILINGRVPPPWVLVGASVGALVVRTFAHRYSDDVAGVVLVDGTSAELDRSLVEVVTSEQMADEYAHGPSAEEYAWARALGPLPNVPLIVLSCAHNPRVPPGWPGEQIAILRRALQDELVTLAPRSRQVVVDCGHAIHRERPDVVVDAIRTVFAAAKTGGVP
jgi:pimeloyl-ACP methyl ester carboxylesterase